jgi:hypothetical protein
MNCPWIIHGLSIDYRWIIHGISMDSQKIIHGNPWTILRLSMNYLLTTRRRRYGGRRRRRRRHRRGGGGCAALKMLQICLNCVRRVRVWIENLNLKPVCSKTSGRGISARGMGEPSPGSQGTHPGRTLVTHL